MLRGSLDKPVFPLRVVFSDGSSVSVEDEEDAATSLEWLDTAVDDDDPVEVYDHLGRRVRLRIEFLEVKEIGLWPE